VALEQDEALAWQALLAYYEALGVDCAIDATPHDRFEESARRPPPPTPIREPTPAPRVAAPAPFAANELVAAAERIAAGAQSLEALSRGLAEFEGLGAGRRARHFLFADGAAGAPLMVMETQPGEAEERSGASFCGPEARLLEAMLKAIGLKRSDAYLAYFAPWRAPGGQAPVPHVADALAPFARRHIALARPKALLLFGDFSKRLLPEAALAGRRLDIRFDRAEVAVFVAPSLNRTLKSAALKRSAWKSLRAARACLAGESRSGRKA